MFDYIASIILMGLGMYNPVNGSVKGITTTNESSTSAKKLNSKAKIASAQSELRNSRLPVTAKREMTFDDEKKAEGARKNFTERLSTIKNESKKQNVEQIDAQLKLINEKRTSEMTRQLTYISIFMQRAEEKIASNAALSTKNRDGIEISKTKATNAVKGALEIVMAQSKKSYVITIPDAEAQIKTEVGDVKKTMEADLKKTHTAIMNAKQSVIQYLKTIQSIGKVN